MDGSTWRLEYKGFDPKEEKLREALSTLGNGYFGTRGSAYESQASEVHYPGTYIAGVYNKLGTYIAGRTVYNEDFVNCPNWIFLTFRIEDGEWFSPSSSKLLSYRQVLDFRKGSLYRVIRFQDRSARRTKIEAIRIVHMKYPHIGAIKYVITPENYSGDITVRSLLDGSVRNTGVERYRELNSKHLLPSQRGKFGRNGAYLLVRTSHSKIEIAQAGIIRVFAGNREIKPKIKFISDNPEIAEQVFKIKVSAGQSYRIEKIVSIYTSRDKGISHPLCSAKKALEKIPSFDKLYQSQVKCWSKLWQKADIQIEGDAFSQKVLRFHMFHLLQTASPNNTEIDAGLPARGLHGESYRGHIFWDSIFTFPFYNLHFPEISKALLLYRYRRLPAARRYAQENGYRGAMFPWQSGSTGEEETQVVHLNPLSGKWGPDYSRYQRHVSLAIAYNVWKYYLITGDEEFISQYGAEILLSIAQFFASLVRFDPQDGRYHTQNVMGPDEFHEKYPDSEEPGLRDNAYTNLMIAWLLSRAKKVLSILPPEEKKRILRKIGLKAKELSLWDEISKQMKLVINRRGVIEQFEGYFNLKELDWERYRKKYGKIERLDRILKAEGKSPDDYKVSKQADVLMIFYLLPLSEVKELFSSLGYHFDQRILERNYEYYIKRTSHGSTLSRVTHCYLSHFLDKEKEAWNWFMEVLKSDILDTQRGTTPEGIHSGVMGGSVDLVIRGFAGVQIFEDKIRIEPALPKKWKRIRFRIKLRETWISISLTSQKLALFLSGSQGKPFPLPFEIGGKFYLLQAGKKYTLPIFGGLTSNRQQ